MWYFVQAPDELDWEGDGEADGEAVFAAAGDEAVEAGCWAYGDEEGIVAEDLG